MKQFLKNLTRQVWLENDGGTESCASNNNGVSGQPIVLPSSIGSLPCLLPLANVACLLLPISGVSLRHYARLGYQHSLVVIHFAAQSKPLINAYR